MASVTKSIAHQRMVIVVRVTTYIRQVSKIVNQGQGHIVLQKTFQKQRKGFLVMIFDFMCTI